jgi:hypothetical protein
VSADGVEVVVDPIDGGDGQRCDVGPGAGVDEFFLVGRECRFADSIVVAYSGPAQGAADAVVPAVFVELCRGVLGSMPLS